MKRRTNRVKEWFFSDKACEDYKDEHGLRTVEECRVGQTMCHPFSTWQCTNDKRKEQFETGTHLEMRFQGRRGSGKKFKILEIKEGGWPDFKSQFNDYILIMERVE